VDDSSAELAVVALSLVVSTELVPVVVDVAVDVEAVVSIEAVVSVDVVVAIPLVVPLESVPSPDAVSSDVQEKSSTASAIGEVRVASIFVSRQTMAHVGHELDSGLAATASNSGCGVEALEEAGSLAKHGLAYRPPPLGIDGGEPGDLLAWDAGSSPTRG
jgi:hypothetical protein